MEKDISAPADTTLPSAPADLSLSPGWIDAARWTALPPLLRAALLGSTLADGQVRAASAYLDRLLRTRYAGEVARLLAEVRPGFAGATVASSCAGEAGGAGGAAPSRQDAELV